MVAEKSKHKALRSVTRTGEIWNNYVISEQTIRSANKYQAIHRIIKTTHKNNKRKDMKKTHETMYHVKVAILKNKHWHVRM